MDVIDASHFEAIKRFMLDRPWWDLKLSCHKDNGSVTWYLTFINSVNNGPFSMVPFIHPTLGEALRLASVWVSEQYAIQERETETVSLSETSSNSETLDEEVREQSGEEGKCHCGRKADGHIDGLCDHCSWTRCDAYPGDCNRPSRMLGRLLSE